jgi:hypothetical protein
MHRLPLGRRAWGTTPASSRLPRPATMWTASHPPSWPNTAGCAPRRFACEQGKQTGPGRDLLPPRLQLVRVWPKRPREWSGRRLATASTVPHLCTVRGDCAFEALYRQLRPGTGPRARLAGLRDPQTLVGWLERQPQLCRAVLTRGRREVLGTSVGTAREVDVVEFLRARLALFDNDPGSGHRECVTPIADRTLCRHGSARANPVTARAGARRWSARALAAGAARQCRGRAGAAAARRLGEHADRQPGTGEAGGRWCWIRGRFPNDPRQRGVRPSISSAAKRINRIATAPGLPGRVPHRDARASRVFMFRAGPCYRAFGSVVLERQCGWAI